MGRVNTLLLFVVCAVCGHAVAQYGPYSDSSDGGYAGLGFASVLDFLLTSESQEVSTSAAAVQASGLATPTLLGSPSFVSVVFVPSNQAWEELAYSSNVTVEDLLADNTTLPAIMAYHIVPLRTVSSMLAVGDDGAAFPTALPSHSLTVCRMDDTRYAARDELCRKTSSSTPIIAGRSVVLVTQKILLPAVGQDPLDCNASPPPPSPSPMPKPPARKRPPPRKPPPSNNPTPPAGPLNLLQALKAEALIFYTGIQGLGALTSLLADSTAEITVFAPVDAAFADLKVVSLSNYFKTAKWAQVAKRTVVDAGAYEPSDLTDKQSLVTFDPITSLRVRLDKGQVTDVQARGISGSIEKDYGKAKVVGMVHAGSGILYLVDGLFNKDTLQSRPVTPKKAPSAGKH